MLPYERLNLLRATLLLGCLSAHSACPVAVTCKHNGTSLPRLRHLEEPYACVRYKMALERYILALTSDIAEAAPKSGVINVRRRFETSLYVVNLTMEQPSGGVVTEVYAKHRNSTQPESQQVCAVLGAVMEVVQSEGLQPTPTALFAALMSSLEKPETQASPQVWHGLLVVYLFPCPVWYLEVVLVILCSGGGSNVHVAGKRAGQGAYSNPALEVQRICTGHAANSGAE